MYNKIVSSLIVIICIFLSSCNSSVKEKNIVVKELFSRDIQLIEDSSVLKYPYRIFKSDSLMLIWDLHGKEYFFHAFNLVDYNTEFLYSFGRVGQGPEEFLACAGMDFQDGLLSIIETNKSILYTYPVSQLKQNNAKPSKILELSKETSPILKFADMGVGGKILLDSKGDSRFLLLDDKGEIESRNFKIPNMENKGLANPILQQLWVSCLDYNPNNNILVIATILGDVIEIYNLKEGGQIIKIGEQGEPKIIRNGQQFILRSANGYQDVIVGNNEIYALYSDITHEEIDEAKKKGETAPNGGNLIYVLDFNAKVKNVFLLNRYINGFYIDFDKKTIYGVTSNSNIQLCIFNY